jgi:flagellum-specific ATP synthase
MTWLKALEDNRDLINIGAYVPGSDRVLDQALDKQEDIRAFLTQGYAEDNPSDKTMQALRKLTEVGS